MGAHMIPLDTAWARFRRQERRKGPAPLSHFMATLSRTCQGFNLDPATPALAWEMISLVPDLSPSQRVAGILLVTTTLADVAQGSTRTCVAQTGGAQHLNARFARLLDAGESPEELKETAALVEMAQALLADDTLHPLVSAQEEAYAPLLAVNGWLSHHRLNRAERLVAGALGQAGPTDTGLSSEAVESAVASVLAAPAGFALSDEQVHAVRRAVSDRLVFISGGPGTGKTSIVVAILRAMARLGVNPAAVAMTAPTGKAAWRMGASVAAGLAAVQTPSPEDRALMTDLPKARTLHRLLEYSPKADRFGRGAEVHLEESVVVIDETSMVDVYLMQRLLAASAPETRLVFLGDADQLPSVAAGAVFRDAISALGDRQVVLTQSFRMSPDDPAGAAVLHVANAINAGRTDWIASPSLLSTEVSPVPVDAPRARGVGLVNCSHSGLADFLSAWFARHVRGLDLDAVRAMIFEPIDGVFSAHEHDALATLFAHTGKARLLCATRVAPEGTVSINRHLHQAMATAMGVNTKTQFLPGEPVLVLRNDYRRQIFNGDQGVVISLRRGESTLLGVVFPGRDGPRVFTLDPLLDRIEHCYAMTIHKSQGSEFEHVGLLLPQASMPLMSRELLYTGVTRSRISVNLVGPNDVLVDAIESPLSRTSGLAERLQNPTAGNPIAKGPTEQ